MVSQVICDRCNKVPGEYARIMWHMYGGFGHLPISKDLCKDCFDFLFPEWKEKEDKEL